MARIPVASPADLVPARLRDRVTTAGRLAADVAALDDAVPFAFDPVALLKKHVKDLAKELTARKSKQIMRGMFHAPMQSNGSRDKGGT